MENLKKDMYIARRAGRKAGEVMIGTVKLDGADTEAVKRVLTEELAKLS